MAPPKRQPYKHAAAAWREHQAAVGLEEALLSGLPARDSAPMHIQAAVAQAVHRLTKTCIIVAQAGCCAPATLAHEQPQATGMPTQQPHVPQQQQPLTNSSLLLADTPPLYPSIPTPPTRAMQALRNVATAPAADILAHAIRVLGPSVTPWAATLTHTYLLLSCPHAQALLLPPCSPSPTSCSSYHPTQTTAASTSPSIPLKHTNPFHSALSCHVDDLAQCSTWRVPIWAYARLVHKLGLEAHMLEVLLAWLPPTPPFTPPNQPHVANNSAQSWHYNTMPALPPHPSTHKHQPQGSVAFLTAALLEWPALAVGVLAELCPPLHHQPSTQGQAQLTFCMQGDRFPNALASSVPILSTALEALARVEHHEEVAPEPQASSSAAAAAAAAAAVESNFTLHGDQITAPSSSTGLANDVGKACVRQWRCLVSVCLAARWALHHLQQQHNELCDSHMSSEQWIPYRTMSVLFGLVELAFTLLESRLCAPHARAPAEGLSALQQEHERCCLRELCAQLGELSADLEYYRNCHARQQHQHSGHLHHCAQQQGTATTRTGLQLPSALLSSIQHSIQHFLADCHSPLQTSATHLQSSGVCGGSCIVGLQIFGRVHEGCGSQGLHRWSLMQDHGLASVHAAPLSAQPQINATAMQGLEDPSLEASEPLEGPAEQGAAVHGQHNERRRRRKQQGPEQQAQQRDGQQLKAAANCQQQQDFRQPQQGNDWLGLFSLQLPVQPHCHMPPHLMHAMQAQGEAMAAAAQAQKEGAAAKRGIAKEASASLVSARTLAALSGAPSNAAECATEAAEADNSGDDKVEGMCWDAAGPTTYDMQAAHSSMLPNIGPSHTDAPTGGSVSAAGWPPPSASLSLRDVWQQHVAGLVCGLLTPGMPCPWLSLQHSAVVSAAAASCFGPLRVSMALLELCAHAHAHDGRAASSKQYGESKATNRDGALQGRVAYAEGVEERGRAGLPDVVSSLLLSMMATSVGSITLPSQQQALQLAVRECVHFHRLMLSISRNDRIMSSAQRALVACCNRMVACCNRHASGVALGGAQEAQLEAESAQELLPHAVLLPHLLVQHLVLDAVRHPGQLPLLLRLLGRALRPAATLPTHQPSSCRLHPTPSASASPMTKLPQATQLASSEPLSVLVVVLREVLGVPSMHQLQTQPEWQQHGRPGQQHGAVQQQQQSHLLEHRAHHQPMEQQHAQIRSPAEQYAFLSLLSGLSGELGVEGQGDGLVSCLVSVPQLMALVAVPALEQSLGQLENRACLPLTVLSHLLKCSADGTAKQQRQQQQPLSHAAAAGSWHAAEAAGAAREGQRYPTLSAICVELFRWEHEHASRMACEQQDDGGASQHRGMEQVPTHVSRLIVGLACVLEGLRQNAVQQGVLDAMSIELATRLLDALVESMCDLATALPQAPYTSEQLLPWVSALLHTLPEVYHCVTTSASNGKFSRSVVLPLLPLLEAVSTLESLLPSAPGAEHIGGAGLSRILVPPSLWRPAASAGAVQQQASEALGFVASSEKHGALMCSCVLEGLQEQLEDEQADEPRAPAAGLADLTPTQRTLLDLQHLLGQQQQQHHHHHHHHQAQLPEPGRDSHIPPHPLHHHSATAHVMARTMQRALACHAPAALQAGLMHGLAEHLPMWSASQAARGLGMGLPLLLRAYGMGHKGRPAVEDWVQGCVAAYSADGAKVHVAAAGADGLPLGSHAASVSTPAASEVLLAALDSSRGDNQAVKHMGTSIAGVSITTTGFALHLLCDAVVHTIPAAEAEKSNGMLKNGSCRSHRTRFQKAVADRCAQHVLAAMQRWLPSETSPQAPHPQLASRTTLCQRWALACTCLHELLRCVAALHVTHKLEAAPLQVALLVALRVVCTPPLLEPVQQSPAEVETDQTGAALGQPQTATGADDVELEGRSSLVGEEGTVVAAPTGVEEGSSKAAGRKAGCQDCLTVLGCSYFEVLSALRAALEKAGRDVPGLRSLALAAVEMAEEHYVSQWGGQAEVNFERLLLT